MAMAVIKYKVSFIGMGGFLWEACVNPKKEGVVITEKRAHEIIEQKGLVLAFKSEDGEVYDTPNKDFLKTHGNGIRIL